MLTITAICMGASVGALARWQLGLWLNPLDAANSSNSIPMGTLMANLIGAYFIGVCIALFQTLPELNPAWRLLLITGFLGALTTFSSFSGEVVAMLTTERYALAIVTTGAHVVGSLVLTILGLRTFMLIWGTNG